MKQFFRELFEYAHHYNQQLGNIITGNTDKISEKTIRLFSHIVNAHQIWNNRIDPKETPFKVWETRPATDCLVIDTQNYNHSLLILTNFDLEKMVAYGNSSGNRFQNSTRDILFHIINHTTYHRAQIATEIRQSGLEPINTDYIMYKR